MADAVQVSSVTLTMSTLLSSLGTLFGGGILALIIRQIGPWRKQTTDAADALIKQLAQRLDKVEQAREIDKRMHYIQLARVEARHAAQRSLDRHKFNNTEGSFDSLLLLLEQAENLPDRLLLAIAKVRERRLADREAEKMESATVHAAEIAAVEAAEKELNDELQQRQKQDKG